MSLYLGLALLLSWTFYVALLESDAWHNRAIPVHESFI